MTALYPSVPWALSTIDNGNPDVGRPLEFHLDVAPAPVINFFFFPFDPSVFDVVQFSDHSFDPGDVGAVSRLWHLGEGATSTDCCPTHQYAKDKSHTVRLKVTTLDGRTASGSQIVVVKTHDVAITKFTASASARVGQTRPITVGLKNQRYPETVTVQLYRSVPAGFELVATSTVAVPVRPKNKTTDVPFTYTFTAADAAIGKVTFKAVAFIVNVRDALIADNEAIAPPTKVKR